MRGLKRLKQWFQKGANASYINLYSEFIIGISVVALLLLTVVSQLFIRSNLSRELSVNTIESEGMDLDVYQRSMVSGRILVRAEGLSDPSKAYLCVNGERICDFTQNPAEIVVRDHALVEVDGTEVNGRFTVRLEDHTENVSLGRQEPVIVEHCFVSLARISLKPY